MNGIKTFEIALLIVSIMSPVASVLVVFISIRFAQHNADILNKTVKRYVDTITEIKHPWYTMKPDTDKDGADLTEVIPEQENHVPLSELPTKQFMQVINKDA